MIALGGSVPALDAGGGWDLVPIVIAGVALLLLRSFLRVRLTPVIVLGTVLAAPLFRALADDAGFTRTVAVTLAFGAAIAVSTRISRRRGTAGPDV